LSALDAKKPFQKKYTIKNIASSVVAWLNVKKIEKGKKMKIEVEVHQKYGKPRFYPANDDAKFITRLIGSPTLTTAHLTACDEWGWEIDIKSPKYELKQFIKSVE